MGLAIDWGNSLIQVTSPTTSVDGQTLSDFIEDQMASPEGLNYSAIQLPEGKIEDPSNPGVFSQIIIILNSPWQVQFWGGSGYTRIFGAKLVGGLTDQPFKATGTAGDITVLESPVDGVTVAVTSDAQMERVLGLLGENEYVDQRDYTGIPVGRLKTARKRIYSDAASVGTDNNVIATYTFTATYVGNDVDTHGWAKV